MRLKQETGHGTDSNQAHKAKPVDRRSSNFSFLSRCTLVSRPYSSRPMDVLDGIDMNTVKIRIGLKIDFNGSRTT